MLLRKYEKEIEELFEEMRREQEMDEAAAKMSEHDDLSCRSCFDIDIPDDEVLPF